MYLTQSLHRAQQQYPDKTALVCANTRRSYRHLADRAGRLAAVLAEAGIGASDHVAILAANSSAYIETYMGLWWLGAVPCPVNTRWSIAEIAYSLQDCQARALIVDAEYAFMLPALRDSVPGLGLILSLSEPATERRMDDATPAPDRRYGGDHLAVVLYTGGTTGYPKGVMLSHHNLACAAVARLAAMPNLSSSVVLLATPLFHAASLGRFLPHLMAGGTCVVLPQFRADTVLDVVEAEGVTDLPLVPSMLQTLLDHPAFGAQRLKSVRRIGYGAAPIDEALLERAMRLLPDVDLMQSYGMTECAALATLSLPTDHGPEARASGRSRSAGRACTVTELRIVDAGGNGMPDGSIGEITVRGPNVMRGYWNRPVETAQALRNGWLHTGDAGYLDAAGCLYVVDRIKDMIVTGGENVYSAEVENVLLMHPAVQACAVFAIPSPQWGEAVHAHVVLRAGTEVDEASLRVHCHTRLAGYKCPKQIELTTTLPLTAAGKVAKNLLRERYWAGHTRRVA